MLSKSFLKKMNSFSKFNIKIQKLSKNLRTIFNLFNYRLKPKLAQQLL